MEILSTSNIRKENEIKGKEISKEEIKPPRFSDGITVRRSQGICKNELLELISQFRRVTRNDVNIKCLLIGQQ